MWITWSALIGLLSAGPIALQDVGLVGDWEIQFANEAPTLRIVILRAGERHLATLVAPNGETLQAAISTDGQGVTIRFTVPDRTPVALVMTGTVDGDRMTGTADFNGRVSAAWTATQREASGEPSDSRDAVRVYLLGSDGFLLHEQYEGVLRKIAHDGREVARVRVPAATFMRQRTDIVLSADHTRASFIYSDAEEGVTQTKHRILVLQTDTLRTVATLQLGLCTDARQLYFPKAAEVLTMVCQHSKDPAAKSAKPTVALVWLDVKEGRVLRWFPLGGRRRGMWFGPMFFGYSHDNGQLPIKTARHPCPPVEPPVPFSNDAAGSAPLTASEFLLVIRREKSGDVWIASTDAAETPRQIAALPLRPDRAILCGATSASVANRRWLFLIHDEAPKGSAIDDTGLFRNEHSSEDPWYLAPGRYVTVLDAATRRIVEPPKKVR